MLSDLRFGLRLSAHSVSEWTSDASSVADRDDRLQPLMESVCDNGLVKDIHMASLIQYVWSDTSKVEGWGRGEVLLRETLDRQAPGTGQPD